jgi:hypothetical protein
MAEPDPPRGAGIPMPRIVPDLVERRQFYVVVLCGDGYEHEFLLSEILDLYTGRTRGTYSPLCRQLVQPETSPSPRAAVRCTDCARRRAAITPEPVWWADPRPLLQALTDYFARYYLGGGLTEG